MVFWAVQWDTTILAREQTVQQGVSRVQRRAAGAFYATLDASAAERISESTGSAEWHNESANGLIVSRQTRVRQHAKRRKMINVIGCYRGL